MRGKDIRKGSGKGRGKVGGGGGGLSRLFRFLPIYSYFNY